MTSASDSIVVIRHDVECVTAEKHYTPCGTAGGKRVIAAGTTASLGHSPLPLDITVDEDVAVPMRDGVVVYADIYRPAHATELIPAILQVGPFGKNGGPNKHNFNKWPWRFGCPKIATSGLEGFEALDPAYWCLHGYAIVCVDTRGTWKSTGNVAGFSKKEGEDNYDVIEFLADLPWCNGKISMAGNSYLAITQWFTGAEQPPHLACLAPWEGMSDLYSDAIRCGGISDPGFLGGLFRGDIASLTGSKVDNFVDMCYQYPTWNSYWEQHRPALERIVCPLYVVASWTNALHTYGTFRAWQNSSSSEKWLRIHNSHEWPDLYNAASREDLRKFYDCYLKGVNSDWKFTPSVRLSVLNAGGMDIVNRPENTFPLTRQVEHKLYLNAETNELSNIPSCSTSSFSHSAVDGWTAVTITFPTRMELVGYSKLHIWAEAEGSNDMDIFVQLQKVDRQSGKVLETMVTDVGYLTQNPDAERQKLLTQHEANPDFGAAYFNDRPKGKLRASHRELDRDLSTPLHPVYTHREEQLLSPGEVVCLDISIWPYGWIVEPDEELRLTISSFDPSPHLRLTDAKPQYRNRGIHRFHAGGKYDSFLLLPHTNA